MDYAGTIPISNEESDNIEINYCIQAPSETNNIHQPSKKVRFVSKKKKWIRHNPITRFYRQGSANISRLFPNDLSPDKIKFSSIKSKKKQSKRVNENVDQPLVDQLDSIITRPPAEFFPPNIPNKETIRPISFLSPNEIMTDKSILSSYRIIPQMEDLGVKTENETETELLKKGISIFLETCERIMSNVITTTNEYLSQFVDLDEKVLVPKQEDSIKVYNIEQWTHIRILEDQMGQRYIALKSCHSLAWFLSSRQCPKLNHRWVCYPIELMTTLEAELSMTEEDSLRSMILRMILLKGIKRIYKNESGSVKINSENILLVASACGIIVVFKKGQNDLDVQSLGILGAETLGDVPGLFKQAKAHIREEAAEFFNRIGSIPVLISSVWPMDYLAYVLARLI